MMRPTSGGGPLCVDVPVDSGLVFSVVAARRAHELQRAEELLAFVCDLLSNTVTSLGAAIVWPHCLDRPCRRGKPAPAPQAQRVAPPLERTASPPPALVQMLVLHYQLQAAQRTRLDIAAFFDDPRTVYPVLTPLALHLGVRVPSLRDADSIVLSSEQLPSDASWGVAVLAALSPHLRSVVARRPAHSGGIVLAHAYCALRGLALNSAIELLDLTANPLLASGAVLIADLLRSSRSLSTLALHDAHLSREGGLAIARALADSPCLRSLDLSRNNLHSPVAHALAAALRAGSALRALSLEENAIGDAGVMALAKALKVNARLRILLLARNAPVSDAGAIALSDALRFNTALEALALDGTGVGRRGLLALVDGVAHNSSLLELSVPAGAVEMLGQGGRCALCRMYAAKMRDGCAGVPGPRVRSVLEPPTSAAGADDADAALAAAPPPRPTLRVSALGEGAPTLEWRLSEVVVSPALLVALVGSLASLPGLLAATAEPHGTAAPDAQRCWGSGRWGSDRRFLALAARHGPGAALRMVVLQIIAASSSAEAAEAMRPFLAVLQRLSHQLVALAGSLELNDTLNDTVDRLVTRGRRHADDAVADE